MKLIEVYSARRHHKNSLIIMEVRAEIGGVEMDIPFGYAPGDPHGLGPEIEAWWAANPDYPIGDAAPIEITPDMIKRETQRRILEVMPEHAQRNALARLIELSADPAGQIEREALLREWAKINAIRARSNALEATLPQDYADDKWWA